MHVHVCIHVLTFDIMAEFLLLLLLLLLVLLVLLGLLLLLLLLLLLVCNSALCGVSVGQQGTCQHQG